MSSIPSVVAKTPIVLVPGEEVLAAADVSALLPKSSGVPLESVVSVEAITVTPAAGLTVSDAGEALVDSYAISLWLDAAEAAHGNSFTVEITFKSRASGDPGDGSLDRTRKAICPVLIRSRDLR